MRFSAAAILCVRNEAIHIRRCIESLIQEEVDVFVIDHSSTDKTAELAGAFVGRGVIDVVKMPYTKVFSLTAQLQRKYREAVKLRHDWLIHVDADEWLQAKSDTSLLCALERIDREGYNCVDFDEFVFLPIAGEDFCTPDYHKLMRRYYFYRRNYSRLLRAWKRKSDLENVISGGHDLTGTKVALYPHRQILRHYICLSRHNFLEKYANRLFAPDELEKGWHWDRERVKRGFRWPDNERPFHLLPAWNSKEFNFSDPKPRHFWEL